MEVLRCSGCHAQKNQKSSFEIRYKKQKNWCSASAVLCSREQGLGVRARALMRRVTGPKLPLWCVRVKQATRANDCLNAATTAAHVPMVFICRKRTDKIQPLLAPMHISHWVTADNSHPFSSERWLHAFIRHAMLDSCRNSHCNTKSTVLGLDTNSTDGDLNTGHTKIANEKLPLIRYGKKLYSTLTGVSRLSPKTTHDMISSSEFFVCVRAVLGGVPKHCIVGRASARACVCVCVCAEPMRNQIGPTQRRPGAHMCRENNTCRWDGWCQTHTCARAFRTTQSGAENNLCGTGITHAVGTILATDTTTTYNQRTHPYLHRHRRTREGAA